MVHSYYQVSGWLGFLRDFLRKSWRDGMAGHTPAIPSFQRGKPLACYSIPLEPTLAYWLILAYLIIFGLLGNFSLLAYFGSLANFSLLAYFGLLANFSLLAYFGLLAYISLLAYFCLFAYIGSLAHFGQLTFFSLLAWFILLEYFGVLSNFGLLAYFGIKIITFFRGGSTHTILCMLRREHAKKFMCAP